jgi:cytochrome c oxidase subunit 2
MQKLVFYVFNYISLFYLINFYVFNNSIYSDVPEKWQFGFQDPATPTAEGMIFFHNYLVYFILCIGIFVVWMLYKILKLFSENKELTIQNFCHASLLEFWWTIIPALILLLIAIPSFNLLYSLDEIVNPSITVKIVGHQWYWSYEYSDFATTKGLLNYDSYMIPTDKLTLGAFRLLEVDHRLVLPINTHIRLLVTSADVLHSWAVPSFGIKVDACPGRLSQASLFIKRIGVYYGQCSEICGVNHGFMPIVVKAITVNNYTKWLFAKLS